MESTRVSLGEKLKFLAVAGVGFFADGYLNLSIGLVVPMIGYIYFKDEHNSLPVNSSDTIKGSLSIGMIVGQLLFGVLGDTLGRHRVYGKELLVTMFGTLMCILLPWKGLSHDGIVAWFAVWRILTGFGIGGDYPMSSTFAAEKTPLGSRAVMVLTVFSFIGLGAFTSSIVLTILLAAFKSDIEHDINHLEWVWRLLMGLGLVPCALTLYARLVIKETLPYQKFVSQKSTATRSLSDQFRDFRVYFANPKHARALFSVCAAWFLYDIAYYGINLNQSVILSRIGYGTGSTPYLTLWHTAIGNIIVQVAGYLPGFYIGIFLPDRIGRKQQQFWCALGTAVAYAIWAGIVHLGNTGGMMAMFTISQLVLNMGPNVTTFLIPTELFPTRVRGTAHGIAAASGKAGAVLTSFAFGQAADAMGIQGVLGLFSGVMFLVALCTFLIPETKGFNLEDLESEKLYGVPTQSNSDSDESPKALQASSESGTEGENTYGIEEK